MNYTTHFLYNTYFVHKNLLLLIVGFTWATNFIYSVTNTVTKVLQYKNLR